VSATGVSLDVARELRAICGEEHVEENVRQRVGLMPSETRIGSEPGISCAPGSVEEIAAVVRMANARGFSVIPRGGRTEPLYADANVSLDTTRLQAVEHYDAADLTVGIGAGTTIHQLDQLVRADRLMFAADPAFPEFATIGGALAVAKQGPLRHGYGGIRDFCIGIRFVTGDGRVAKGGGRVVKNVAGYDLMKLLIGSYGTLAVITSASFKLFPAPRQTRTFLAEFATADEALQFRDLMLRSALSPMCLEIVSPRARRLMRPEMSDDAWVICVRASGSDAVLARYRKELGSAVTRELEGENETEMWRRIENFPSPRMVFPEYVWSGSAILYVPISRVAAAIRIVEKWQESENIDVAFIGRVAVGSLTLRVCTRKQPEGVHPERLDRLWHDLEVDCQAGNTFYGTPHSGISQEAWRCMRAVKLALDPKNVLRGREIF
jgi:glycolate oxidase FAD binding subunit